MKRKIVVFSIAILSVFICYKANASNWYVDNAVAITGDGQSWSTAWKNLSNIIWGSINAGDTIYISGGSTSKTYQERFKVMASGSELGGFITIQTGQESGHNGTVIIESDYYQGIIINDCSYIKISGQVGDGSDCKMKITNAPSHGIDLLGTSEHILLEYLDIDGNGSTSGSAGIHASFDSHPNDIEIRYCKIHDNYNDGITFAGAHIATGFDLVRIHHNEIYNVHDDGVEYWPGGLSFYNNKIYDRTIPHRGHPDGMQLYNEKYVKIYNNEFEWYNSADYGAGALPAIYMPCNGSLIGGGSGDYDPHDIYIFNNIFYEDTEYIAGTYPVVGISLGFSDSTILQISNIFIVNNYFKGDYLSAIIMGWDGTSLNKEDISNFEIANNVFDNASYSPNEAAIQISIPNNAGGDNATWGSYGDGDNMIMDHNIYYGDGSSYLNYLNDLQPYQDIVTQSGIQKKGVTSNPSVDLDFKADEQTDPIIASGRDLSQIFDFDKENNPRPEGTWDIGPYQSQFDVTDLSPPGSPSNLIVVQ